MPLVDEQDQLTKMYAVARDDELAVLDAVAERAALCWSCQAKPEHEHPWTNPTGEPCGRCGRTQAQAASTDAGAR